MDLETPEEYYARIAAATDEEGRLPVAVEEMPGWDIFPFEIDSLRIKPLQALAEVEPPRAGEDPADCWCADGGAPDPERVIWSNERWRLTLESRLRLPLAAVLGPREHHDLHTLTDELAGEMGRLTVALAGVIEELPSVGRTHVQKIGDGGAHLHLFFLGRPARILQFRGSPLLDWEENLPEVPVEVHRANAAYVGARLVEQVGGSGPSWG